VNCQTEFLKRLHFVSAEVFVGEALEPLREFFSGQLFGNGAREIRAAQRIVQIFPRHVLFSTRKRVERITIPPLAASAMKGHPD
jgi:hypothetical protein